MWSMWHGWTGQRRQRRFGRTPVALAARPTPLLIDEWHLVPQVLGAMLLCMADLGEVSVTVWPQVLKDMCAARDIHVLE
jgi:hypothetical protein